MTVANNQGFLKVIYYVREGEARYVTVSRSRCAFIVVCGFISMGWMATSLLGAAVLYKQNGTVIPVSKPEIKQMFNEKTKVLLK